MLGHHLVIRRCDAMSSSARPTNSFMRASEVVPAWKRSRQQGALRMYHHDETTPAVSACADSGQAGDDIEFRQPGKLAAVDARARLVDPTVRQGDVSGKVIVVTGA